ncbi:MAG: hypothetical protein AAGD14_07410 [Planctomycetota bacterium]
MKSIVALLLSALAVGAKPGPDTATRVEIASTDMRASVRMRAGGCPQTVDIELAFALPNPGCTIESAKAVVDRKNRRIRIALVLEQKGGAWPQVIVPTKRRVHAGVLRKGRHIVEVHVATRGLAPSRPTHVFLLDAR